MEDCIDIDGCDWISYSQESQLCLLLDTCTLETSENFVSAHQSCGLPKISKNYQTHTNTH